MTFLKTQQQLPQLTQIKQEAVANRTESPQPLQSTTTFIQQRGDELLKAAQSRVSTPSLPTQNPQYAVALAAIAQQNPLLSQAQIAAAMAHAAAQQNSAAQVVVQQQTSDDDKSSINLL